MRAALTTLGVFGCAIAAPATARAVCPSPLTEGLSPPAATQSFRQERHLKGASRPIVSSGVVSIEDGVVVWRVTTPIEIVTRIADDGVTQSIEGGPFDPVGEASGSGFSSRIGFAALLRADMNALKSSYTIKEAKSESEPDWAYVLSPRDPQLAEQIAAIDVEGCTTLKTVRVRQASGDMIVISLAEPAG